MNSIHIDNFLFFYERSCSILKLVRWVNYNFPRMLRNPLFEFLLIAWSQRNSGTSEAAFFSSPEKTLTIQPRSKLDRYNRTVWLSLTIAVIGGAQNYHLFLYKRKNIKETKLGLTKKKLSLLESYLNLSDDVFDHTRLSTRHQIIIGGMTF